MQIRSLVLALAAAFLASASPAPASSTTPIPDQPATPGYALTNAYWLTYVNQARKAISLANIPIGNNTLAKQAAEWSQQCIYGREDMPSGFAQANTWVNASSTKAIKEVIEAATGKWKEQSTYSIIAYPSASQLGCSATYCSSITVGENFVLPLIEPENGWVANCILKYA
ncbi:hypothetical protein JCM11641_005881 [Rhodosporidiobolus odoratus]